MLNSQTISILKDLCVDKTATVDVFYEALDKMQKMNRAKCAVHLSIWLSLSQINGNFGYCFSRAVCYNKGVATKNQERNNLYDESCR